MEFARPQGSTHLLLRTLLGSAFAITFAFPAAVHAQPLDSATLNGFRWRAIGPATMGGRISDVEGIPSPSHTFYVAAATGGIWKTTNAGTTFSPIFDNERIVSMGDLAIAPSDTNQIWAGTGEPNVRNGVARWRPVQVDQRRRTLAADGTGAHAADRPDCRPSRESQHRIRCDAWSCVGSESRPRVVQNGERRAYVASREIRQ